MSMLTGAAVLDTDTLGRALVRSTEWPADLETDTEGRALLMSTEWPADFETDTLAPADFDASTDLETDTWGRTFWMSMLTGAAVLDTETLGRALVRSTEWPADFETDTLAPAEWEASTDLDTDTWGRTFWMSMLTGAAVLETDTLGTAFWMSMDLVATAWG
jgi:hypothetical protein